ncbi:helix-turn-helix domain-containing protein [Nocardia otitidiscaviarum]|uniref:helix-turn-helix domain-containing protein n=1 Tax=Nocardia otitidiscaviarum TaxID=1823 RepID=UPI0004A6BE14|nr:helix-turn-helix transcriptional regulator [Nocardia otitidiscaviarum]MBF6133312.1 helix-turn-helix domain-containing protein [Nocardia otitidiscaviarum]MBF6486708.1 helix-turn-helix domain-containing protein [Nocardia otitidiscaviarum]
MSSGVQEARQALGQRLREIRRRAGLSGRQLARLSGWHETKVSKIEYGRVKPSDADIRAYCAHAGAVDQLEDLLATVHNIDAAYLEYRRQHAAGLQRGQQKSARLAERSKIVRIFQPAIIPGILQTAEYAEGILRHSVEFYRLPDDVDGAVAKRIERQHFLYRGERRFHILVAEQALYTSVDTDAVMLGQLDRLLAVVGLSRVLLGIIPARSGPPMQTTNFVMFDDRLVTVEAITAELSITQPREIALYGRTFDTLARRSVTGDKARALIRKAIAARGNP